MTRLRILFLLLLVQPLWAQVQPTERPFLWMIEGEQPSFLYGTFHLPDKRVLALPPVVEKAAGSVDGLYVEVTPDELAGAAAQMMLPDGKSLKDVLPEDLYNRTRQFVESKGLPFMALQRLKPWVLTVQLQLLDYIQQLATRQPLDMMLFSRARQAGKEVGGIETLEEQLSVFEEFSQEEQVQLLKEALDQLENDPERTGTYMERLLLAYLGGEEEKLYETLFEEVDLNDPVDQKFVRLVFTQRDIRMAERIAARLQENPGRSYFFAVGAGHLVSQNGVRKHLEAQGYRITRLTPQDVQRFQEKEK